MVQILSRQRRRQDIVLERTSGQPQRRLCVFMSVIEATVAPAGEQTLTKPLLHTADAKESSCHCPLACLRRSCLLIRCHVESKTILEARSKAVAAAVISLEGRATLRGDL